MSRVLLADDSAHAQRMGEFILREEGFEIVSVTDGATAMVRLADVDPDLVLADVGLPQHNGYELCRFIKSHPNHRHVKVVLTAGAQEPIDDDEAGRAGADGRLHKPFEASAVIELARRLAAEACQARLLAGAPGAGAEAALDEAGARPTRGGEDAAECVAAEETPDPAGPSAQAPEPVVDQEVTGDAPGAATAVAPLAPPDQEAVRAAVTLALESALPVLIDEITRRVILAIEEVNPPGPAATESIESDGAAGA